MNMVKYPGGKERELTIIFEHLPETIQDYFEPFVGGGSVYLSMNARHYYINDFSKDLICLYRCVAEQDQDFFECMQEINALWKNMDVYAANDKYLFETYTAFRDNEFDEDELKKQVDEYIKSHAKELLGFVAPMNCGGTETFLADMSDDFVKKFVRMKELNYKKQRLPDEDIRANILGVFKASFYMYLRKLYSHMGHYTNGFKAMLYLFIRDFCYSSMFRFNSNGEFNVPYGGISYNGKTYDKIIEKYHSAEILSHTAETTFGCADYREFLSEHVPQKGDFMFVDPPYDSSFSTYDQKEFDAQEQKALADYLLNKCECNFMLDIKYTDFIASLYEEGRVCKNGGKLRIVDFDKNYSVSFMNRNAKKARHILVMNY